jgi:amidohydrolase
MHNWPGLAAGKFAVHNHAVMAAVDTIYITIKGKGGHAAMPDQLVDPILTGANVISALQSIVSRTLSPLDSAVISITIVNAGTASNVMPDEMKITGTLRYLNTEIGQQIKLRIKEVVENTCAAMGATSVVDIKSVYPATINTPKHADICAKAAGEIAGNENILRDLPPTMGAEDFSFMLNAKEGAYIWIGNGEVPEGQVGGACMLHNTHYDFNDDVLPLGASYWIQLVKNSL